MQAPRGALRSGPCGLLLSVSQAEPTAVCSNYSLEEGERGKDGGRVSVCVTVDPHWEWNFRWRLRPNQNAPPPLHPASRPVLTRWEFILNHVFVETASMIKLNIWWISQQISNDFRWVFCWILQSEHTRFFVCLFWRLHSSTGFPVFNVTLESLVGNSLGAKSGSKKGSWPSNTVSRSPIGIGPPCPSFLSSVESLQHYVE